MLLACPRTNHCAAISAGLRATRLENAGRGGAKEKQQSSTARLSCLERLCEPQHLLRLCYHASSNSRLLRPHLLSLMPRFEKLYSAFRAVYHLPFNSS